MRLGGRGRRGPATPTLLVAVALGLAAAALPPLAFAHLERPSYWPDPRPDTSITPAAGGEVPEARSLESAATGAGPGEVRVVCQGPNGSASLRLLDRSIQSARKDGFRLRPSQEETFLTRAQATELRQINRDLAAQCAYRNIQEAIFASGNNDRVVVMPGRYLEEPSRRQPTNDPRCADLTQDNGSGGQAPSYRYQVTCPNDQNLIYIQGREVGAEPPPEPPLEEREGIPDLGPCARCNLQLEGSGVKPEDVTIDAGQNYRDTDPEAKPGVANGCNFEPECSYAKDVVLRVDRADGFVGRNFLTKSSTEHGVYVEETDGYLLDKTKFFWSAEYGNLSFTSDHGLYENCDSFGAGDAAVYPGAAPETGVDVDDRGFYPDAPRINTVVRDCDLRSSALAYSGSMGNAVRITNNEIYANTTGVVTDSISAGGHPGYPPDSVQVDHNNIYSNNLDSYGEDAPFVNTVGLPIGVGIMWPGVNSSAVEDNHIFDNWRRGTMLAAIPEPVTRGEPEDTSPSACEKPPDAPPPATEEVAKTSCENTYRGNFMGMAPPGFEPSPAVGKFGNPSSLDSGERNGVDFWWDEFPGNEGNCWAPSNVGSDGTHESITSDPQHNPVEHGVNAPKLLPEECDPQGTTWPLGVGTGAPEKEAELAICGEAAPGCPWFTTPPEPSNDPPPVQARAGEAVLGAGTRLSGPFHSISTISERR